MTVRRGRWLSAGLLLLAACGQQQEAVQQEAPQYTRSVPDYATRAAHNSPPPVTFTDVTAASGIDFEHETGDTNDLGTRAGTDHDSAVRRCSPA